MPGSVPMPGPGRRPTGVGSSGPGQTGLVTDPGRQVADAQPAADETIHWFRDAVRESPAIGVVLAFALPVVVVALAVAGVLPAGFAFAVVAAVAGCWYGIRHNRLRR